MPHSDSKINTNEIQEGSLVFLSMMEDGVTKRRPVIVVKILTVRGVVYNYWGFKLTSSKQTITDEIIVSHPKLSVPTYVKLIDPITFKIDDVAEVKEKFKSSIVNKIMKKFNEKK